jgi:hypothetical protein
VDCKHYSHSVCDAGTEVGELQFVERYGTKTLSYLIILLRRLYLTKSPDFFPEFGDVLYRPLIKSWVIFKVEIVSYLDVLEKLVHCS